MKYQLKQSVRDEVVRLFDSADVEYVLRTLETTTLTWERSAPLPRVHVAVIWQSNGDLEEFKKAIGESRSDWRNTLVWNGLGNEDWRQVLTDAGVESTDW